MSNSMKTVLIALLTLFSFCVLTGDLRAEEMNASALTDTMSKIIASMGKVMKEEGIKKTKSKADNAFWKAMNDTIESVALLTESVKNPDKKFFDRLQTARKMACMLQIASLNAGSPNPRMKNLVNDLVDTLNVLNDNYGRNSLRLRKVEKITAQEIGNLEKIQGGLAKVSDRLASLEKKNSDNSSLKADIEQMRDLANSIKTAKTATITAPQYVYYLNRYDFLTDLYYASRVYWVAFYPTYYTWFTVVDRDWRIIDGYYYSTVDTAYYTTTDWDYLKTEVDVSSEVINDITSDITKDITSEDVAEFEKYLDKTAEENAADFDYKDMDKYIQDEPFDNDAIRSNTDTEVNPDTTPDNTIDNDTTPDTTPDVTPDTDTNMDTTPDTDLDTTPDTDIDVPVDSSDD